MVMTLKFQYDSHSNPRLAMVIWGDFPEKRKVSDDQGIHFLSLPRAVRNNIYSQVVVKPDAFIGAESRQTKPFYKDAIAWRNLAFASTCRQVWNESLEVYISQNGFEFFYIRPFLEFLEKIGIRGRRLLTQLKSHHHYRSNPFIVLRLLRSCIHLQVLEVSARIRSTDRKGVWFTVPLRNAKKFFLGDLTSIEFGPTGILVAKAGNDVAIPDLATKDASGAFMERSLRSLANNLKRVKLEVSGKYKRPDLPDIYENGMCHWKLRMIEAHERKRKAEKKARDENAKKRKTTNEEGEPGKFTATETCESPVPEDSSAAIEVRSQSQVTDEEEDILGQDEEEGMLEPDDNGCITHDGDLLNNRESIDDSSVIGGGKWLEPADEVLGVAEYRGSSNTADQGTGDQETDLQGMDVYMEVDVVT